jgi:hypothetical protein
MQTLLRGGEMDHGISCVSNSVPQLSENRQFGSDLQDDGISGDVVGDAVTAVTLVALA